MSLSRGSLIRGVLLLALIALVQTHIASSVANAASPGRDVSACVKTCNSIRISCEIECPIDCADLYPPGDERTACIDGCKASCIDDMQECKAKCDIYKPKPSPTEP